MNIEKGYYIAKCASNKMPFSRKDANTFYLPFNIREKDGGYEFDEYRFNLPVNYDISMTIIELMAEELDDCRKALAELGVE